MGQLYLSIDMEEVLKKKRGPQSIGRGRKGIGTTMHLSIAQNSVVNCQLFPDQRQDCKTVEQLWQDLPWEKIGFGVADKGYDNGNIRNFIKSKNAIPVIPFKGVYLPTYSSLTPEDFYDTKLYQKRHIIERLFGRLKENKRIAMRFDKLDCTFLNFIALALIKAYNLFC
ncbi:transposase [Candidatus Tisiphia endosymbiont of Nemotelus uliginosus]|uniref:transposase n=1 Tax=Candidatus Tisiphia endosymbiont of Nemotelus uliginosus TaxID=3077926 RepID=UPI0035C9290B